MKNKMEIKAKIIPRQFNPSSKKKISAIFSALTSLKFIPNYVSYHEFRVFRKENPVVKSGKLIHYTTRKETVLWKDQWKFFA